MSFPFDPLSVQVARVTQEAVDIRSDELVDPAGAQLPAFSAGAHLNVVLPSGQVRHYSLANDPAERHRYLIAVLREAGGRGDSQEMHDRVRIGDRLEISAPINNFPLSSEARRHLFIAGGIGITPILSMMRQAAREGADWTLHFEYFTLDETAADAADNLAFEVEIASSGRVFQIPADKSILEVLEAHGLEVPSLCTEGLCGTCITGVLEGEPDHRDVILDDEEKAGNTLMTICCSRAKGGRLKLDL